jgi:hypothetical protein
VIVARVYTVLDQVVAEVSCVHADNPMASHLVIRESARPYGDPSSPGLRALVRAVEMALHLEESRAADAGSGCCDLFAVA